MTLGWAAASVSGPDTRHWTGPDPLSGDIVLKSSEFLQHTQYFLPRRVCFKGSHVCFKYALNPNTKFETEGQGVWDRRSRAWTIIWKFTCVEIERGFSIHGNTVCLSNLPRDHKFLSTLNLHNTKSSLQFVIGASVLGELFIMKGE